MALTKILSSMASFLQSGTGASPRTVQDKLRETVSVRDFGAIGDGIVDDTASIQSAINYLRTLGGNLMFPAGTYKITSSLNLINPANLGASGIFFVGCGGVGGPYGPKTSILKSYIASGPLLQVQGTKSFATGGQGSIFMSGGGIRDLYFDGTNATGTSQALRVQGWQYGEVSGCTFTKFPGDCVTQWCDAGFPNGDYSSTSLNFKNCWFWDNTGMGVNQTGYVGAWSWKFDKCLFGYCSVGATITSAGNSFDDCSFVGNGFSSSGVALPGGSHLIFGSSSGSINRCKMTGCEFDYARNSHVTLDYIQTVEFNKCRFIFRDRDNLGLMCPKVSAIYIAGAGAGSNVAGIRIADCNVRIDVNKNVPVTGAVNNGSGLIRLTLASHGYTTGNTLVVSGVTGVAPANGTWVVTVVDANTVDLQSSTFSGTYTGSGSVTKQFAFDIFYLVNTANVSDIVISGTTFSDNSNGAYIPTKYQGSWTSGNVNLRNGYRIAENGATLVAGKPAPFYLGRSTTAQALATGSYTQLVFPVQDTLNSQLYPAGVGAFSDTMVYNTSTGIFKAPRAGYYDVMGFINVDGVTAADTLRMQILAGGLTYSFDAGGVANTSGIFGMVIPHTRVFCASGDTISVQVRSVNNARSLSATGGYNSHLSISPAAN